MKQPLILAAAILLLGAVYVVPAVVTETYRRYRGRRMVTCPETGRPASVQADASHAALTSAVGRPQVRLSDCSRWPEKIGCDRQCLGQLRS